MLERQVYDMLVRLPQKTCSSSGRIRFLNGREPYNATFIAGHMEQLIGYSVPFCVTGYTRQVGLNNRQCTKP
jgi:hypothetical protein